MALHRNALLRFAELIANGTIERTSVLTIGRQSILTPRGDIHKLLRHLGLPVSDESLALPLEETPPMEEFFSLFGFKRIESLDVNDYENCTIIHDMNNPLLPGPLSGAFSLIIDGGSMEHVFNVPVFLKNIHEMLSVNGVVFHNNPTNGYIDHGYYQFSPCLFHDYYTTNKYKILSISVNRMEIRKSCREVDQFDYVPNTLGRQLVPEQDIYWFMSLAACQKTASSTSGVSPQQSFG